MSTVTRPRRGADAVLRLDECDAWHEYLEATHNQPEARYTEVESWAWARLKQRLRAIDARRAKLR